MIRSGKSLVKPGAVLASGLVLHDVYGLADELEALGVESSRLKSAFGDVKHVIARKLDIAVDFRGNKMSFG